jgi:hypothetical protein
VIGALDDRGGGAGRGRVLLHQAWGAILVVLSGYEQDRDLPSSDGRRFGERGQAQIVRSERKSDECRSCDAFIIEDFAERDVRTEGPTGKDR